MPGDIAPDDAGNVVPGTGGMSVAPTSMWDVPHHRRPRAMGRGASGPAQDRVYAIDPVAIMNEPLDVRQQSAVHSFVEPSVKMRLAAYETALASTRTSWVQAWP